MDYKQACLDKIQSMDLQTYSKFTSVILAAQQGKMSWEELWKKHLKDSATHRVSLHG